MSKEIFPTLETIMQNYNNIRLYLKETNLLKSEYLSKLVEGNVFLKCEN